MFRYALLLVAVLFAVSLSAAAFGEELKLSAENTKIDFVGTKADGKHDGGFKTITGTAKFDAADLTKTQVNITVDTNSLWADDPKLTGHLKSPDFFDVRKHKSAGFVSTGVKAGAEKGTYTITGDLTLLGVKKSISVPAKVAVTGKDFSLSTYFPIKRSEFGMTYGAGKVDDEVNITATIKGAPQAESPEPRMFELEIIAVGALLPAAIAAGALVAALLASNDEPDSRDRSIYVAGAIACAGAFIIAFGAFSWESIWPKEFRAWHWLPYAAVTVSLLGCAKALHILPAWCYWLVLLPTTFGLAWLLIPDGWEGADTWRGCTALAMSAVASIALLQQAATRSGGPLLPAMLTLNYLAAAIAIERSAWASMTQFAGVMVVIMGVFTVAAWLYPQRFLLQGAAPAAGLLLPAMLMQAWFNTFEEIPGWAMVLIALGPMAVALATLATAGHSPRSRAIAILLGLSLPLSGVVWILFSSLTSQASALHVSAYL